jgi:hypothetical protein
MEKKKKKRLVRIQQEQMGLFPFLTSSNVVPFGSHSRLKTPYNITTVQDRLRLRQHSPDKSIREPPPTFQERFPFSSRHSHVMAPHCTIFVIFTHLGRAYLRAARRRYLRSRRNWCFGDSFDISGGHCRFGL